MMGVSINMISSGFTLGFTSILLFELKESKFIILTDDEASWFASISGIGLMIGILMVPFLMDRFGRQKTILLGTIIMTIGWICVINADSFRFLIFSRFIQGLSMGITSILTPVLIAEYTSPKNRGAFLATTCLSLVIGSSITHSLGLILNWQRTALVCSIITFTNIVIIFLLPESPSFLAANGKYDECRRAYRWLRGYDEEEELEQMLQRIKAVKKEMHQHEQAKTKLNRTGEIFTKFKNVMSRKDFYTPIFLILHLHIVREWSGATLYDVYAVNIVQDIVGKDANLFLIIQSVDIQRILSSALAILIMREMKTRTILLITVPLNIFIYFIISVYVYSKSHGLLPWDHPFIGVVLIHLHMFSVAVGNVFLPNALAEELQFKAVSSFLSSLFLSFNLYVNIKIAPHLFSSIGLSGGYFLFACIVLYAFVVLLVLLPETKDIILHEIEDEFSCENSCNNIFTNSNHAKAIISTHRAYIPTYLDTDV